MNKSLDICCAADICVDLILSGDVVPRFRQVEQILDDYLVELGGSAVIFAGQFAKLGGRAGVVGKVGEDTFGRFVTDRIARMGIDTAFLTSRPDLKTGLGVALARPDGDRAILTYPGTIDAAAPCDLTNAMLSSCRHWHIASYFLLETLRGFWPEWLAKCRAAGITTSLDTNWDPADRWEGVMELLPLVDVFLPNEAEALAVTGESSLEKAALRLAACGPLVVIKQGAKGAAAYRQRGRWASSQESDELTVADTIGAGDNFDAGFIRAWRLGWGIEDCLKLASRCACASLQAPGGFEGQLKEAVD
ncbi:MAG: sugar kinase [Armatimonadetes bacterium]|nr:sugar kinase [Armatimonadota bacterium]